MSKYSGIGSSSFEPLDRRAATFDLDTLELARRGRQEQARVMGALISAGLRRLAALARRALRSASELTPFPTDHSLKGN
ncbi:MAG TPA: hypothetical protein VLA41_11500 [Burkholderiales bacterium]|nr:hypothetical protein [Burkholderiales bacterium]